MKKAPIFLIFLFFLVILVPQVCAQTSRVSAQEAAMMRQTFVEYSKRYIGKPYVRGGTGPDAFDCSGLVFACSRESIGKQLPRQTKAMYAFCEIIDDSEREIGDLVFFKTTGDGSVSHVGIYAGDDHFVNAASDGPNNGVILSSLKEQYWKTHYFKTGRFLPATGKAATGQTAGDSPAGATNTDGMSAAPAATKGGFLSKIVLDATANLDWNFYTAKTFRFTVRGFSTMVHAMYDGTTMRPGVGTMFRYDSKTGVVQIPIVASLTIGNYFRLFFGPVFTLGDPKLPGDSETDIRGSVFPGIMGVCWQTPSFAVGKTQVSFQQDIHYSLYNDTDGSALSFKNSLVSGLVFSTGVRVTMPLKNVL